MTDRGSEFTNPLAIEFNKGNGRRTHIFYCDPQRSDQKGGCEVTHEMIRRVLPKKTSFDNLIQDDINLMMSHINSYNRKKLNNQSAHQLFSFINGGDILDKLGIKSIPANEINLTPPIIIFVFLLLTRFFSHFHFFIEITSKSMSFPLAINHGYTDV